MGFIPGRNVAKARAQADANAAYFGVPFVVFTDTNGNVRVERESVAPKDVAPSYVARPPSEGT